jgi:transposase InsO family protein
MGTLFTLIFKVIDSVPMFKIKEIICDRGTQFSSERWKKALHTIGAEKRMSSSYHQQFNGITERTNQNILTKLRILNPVNESKW